MSRNDPAFFDASRPPDRGQGPRRILRIVPSVRPDRPPQVPGKMWQMAAQREIPNNAQYRSAIPSSRKRVATPAHASSNRAHAAHPSPMCADAEAARKRASKCPPCIAPSHPQRARESSLAFPPPPVPSVHQAVPFRLFTPPPPARACIEPPPKQVVHRSPFPVLTRLQPPRRPP
jgi:hypothetical protein